MLCNDGQHYHFSTIFHSNHHACVGTTFIHTENPVALTVMASVMLLMHKFRFINLKNLTWSTHLHQTIKQILEKKTGLFRLFVWHMPLHLYIAKTRFSSR